MMGRTHIATGATLYASQALLIGPGPHPLIGGAIATLAALGPDLDHSGSTAMRSISGAAFIRRWLARAVNVFAGGHRQGTHSLASIALVGCAGAYFFESWIGWALALGWTAHIVGDFLTVGGVALFYPLSRRKHSAGLSMRTGGLGESVFLLLHPLALVLLWGLATYR